MQIIIIKNNKITVKNNKIKILIFKNKKEQWIIKIILLNNLNKLIKRKV